jgi:tetratricopeptide (TPR) repeat protein
MKQYFISLALTVLISLSGLSQIQTPALSPEQTLNQVIGLSSVSVQYSRPAMRGRTIFGDLVPLDKIWRTGANANTIVNFDSDVSVGGEALKSGSYALYSKPGLDKWTIYFYSDTDNRGLPRSWDEEKIAAEFMVTPRALTEAVESFTISVDQVTDSGATMTIAWENTEVSLPLAFDTEAAVMKSIERTMNGPAAGDYYQAAVYFLNADKDISKAKNWIDKAIAMSERPAYWYYRQKSLIYAKAGDKKGAIAAAEQSLTLAQEAGNMDYVALNKKSLAEWRD